MLFRSPSGKRLAATTLTAVLVVWDIEADRLIAELTAPEAAANSVAYSPDGRCLASGGDDCLLCLWDAETHKLLASADIRTQVRQVSFAPDSQSLFTANGNGTCYQLDVKQLLSAGTS